MLWGKGIDHRGLRDDGLEDVRPFPSQRHGIECDRPRARRFFQPPATTTWSSSSATMQGSNKYYPPDYDPSKHASLNAYHGKHALGDRARKLDKGILITRFELPFNIWW